MKKSPFGKLLVLGFTFSVLAIAVAGCGKDNNDDSKNGKRGPVPGADSKDKLTGSCDQTFENGAHMCTDYLNGKQEILNNDCHQNNGVVSANACATQGRVGYCKVPVDNTATIIIRFYPPTTAEQGKGACDQNGGVYTMN